MCIHRKWGRSVSYDTSTNSGNCYRRINEDSEDCIGVKRTDGYAELFMAVDIICSNILIASFSWYHLLAVKIIKPPQTFQLLLNVLPTDSRLLWSLRLEPLTLLNGGACRFHY